MRRARDESGQVIVLTAVVLPLVLVLLGFVIDYGGSAVLKRKAQAAADASALAAVWSIPNGSGAVQSAASAMAALNVRPGLSATPQVTQGADTVQVKVSGAWSTVFARVFGMTSVGVSATAVAQAQSVLGCSGHGCDVLPWGVPDCAVAGTSVDCSRPLKVSYGQRVTLKTDDGVGGKFYALADPQLHGAACGMPTGAGDYSDAIVGSWGSGGALTCNLRATGGPATGYSTAGCDNSTNPRLPSCTVQVKTGNMVGPTAAGLEARLGCSSGVCNTDSLSYITGGCDPATAPGAYCPVVHNSPRLVVVPIARNLDNSTGYASCSSGASCTVKIVDLVHFYIDATYSDLEGSTVTGIFFRSTAPPSLDLVGPYNGGTLIRAKLVG